jgi:hypothetical protein
MPDGSNTGKDSIFFRDPPAVSGNSLTPPLAVTASAGNTAASPAALDPLPGPAANPTAPALLEQPTLTNATVDLAPPSARPARQSVVGPGRAAVHGTPSTVLGPVFADLDGRLLADALHEGPTPGPTG